MLFFSDFTSIKSESIPRGLEGNTSVVSRFDRVHTMGADMCTSEREKSEDSSSKVLKHEEKQNLIKNLRGALTPKTTRKNLSRSCKYNESVWLQELHEFITTQMSIANQHFDHLSFEQAIELYSSVIDRIKHEMTNHQAELELRADTSTSTNNVEDLHIYMLRCMAKIAECNEHAYKLISAAKMFYDTYSMASKKLDYQNHYNAAKFCAVLARKVADIYMNLPGNQEAEEEHHIKSLKFFKLSEEHYIQTSKLNPAESLEIDKILFQLRNRHRYLTEIFQETVNRS